MRKETAKSLAAAIFNAMYWATEPRATHFRIGAMEGLVKALEEAFPEPHIDPYDKMTDEEVDLHVDGLFDRNKPTQKL